jgi:putative transposase
MQLMCVHALVSSQWWRCLGLATFSRRRMANGASRRTWDAARNYRSAVVIVAGVRYPRFKLPPEKGEAYYHVMSRTVNGEWLFQDVEKEMLRRHIWQVADYCGVQVLTYAVMSNHFHIVVRVPKKEAVGDTELLRRYQVLHSGVSAWEKLALTAIERMLAEDGPEAWQWRQRQMAMMGDISPYLQLLKQRYSIWFNRTHGRFGTLWAERYKSVLLGGRLAVRTVAAYVDLNPVRAGLVRDPKDYRFCGYAQAVAGDSRARAGIALAVGSDGWDAAQGEYRVLIFRRAAKKAGKGAAISSSEQAAVATKSGGLSLVELVASRSRYLTDGAILGTKAFVLAQIGEYRRTSGRGQRTDARPLRGDMIVGRLAVMRNIIAASA